MFQDVEPPESWWISRKVKKSWDLSVACNSGKVSHFEETLTSENQVKQHGSANSDAIEGMRLEMMSGCCQAVGQ